MFNSSEDTIKILFESALVVHEPVEDCDCITHALEKFGFSWKAIKPKKGEKRPIVSDFANENNGTYILRVSGHVVCVKDNKHYDIWDSGDKSLYGYWHKTN